MPEWTLWFTDPDGTQVWKSSASDILDVQLSKIEFPEIPQYEQPVGLPDPPPELDTVQFGYLKDIAILSTISRIADRLSIETSPTVSEAIAAAIERVGKDIGPRFGVSREEPTIS